MKTSDEVLELAGITLRDLCVREHQDGQAWLGVEIEDGDIIDAEYVEDKSDNESYMSTSWHIVKRVGTGSCSCNCDACVNGDDPEDWAGDDNDALEAMDDAIQTRINEIAQEAAQ